jgi:hypothetical protein
LDLESLFFGAHVRVSRELGLSPTTWPGSDSSANAAADRFAAWARESDADLSADVRAMVPVFYDLERRKVKVWIFLGWSSRPIAISFAQPPQAVVRDVNGRPLRHHPPIRWGALRVNVPYPVTAELYVDRLLDRDEFRKLCDSCGTQSEIVRCLNASGRH